MFLSFFQKKYSPYDVDQNALAFFCQQTRCIPIFATSMVDNDVKGCASVNGVKIDSGNCIRIEFIPFPVLFLPVGQVALDFDKTYTVKLSGYKDIHGHKFLDHTFKIKTTSKLINDNSHLKEESVAKEVSDEGIVLLKNDGTLPLKENAKVKLLGEYKDFRITATGAGFIKPRSIKLVDEALKDDGLIESDDASIGIYFLSRGSGENKDNKPMEDSYYLTAKEREELEECSKRYEKLILVLNTGYPIEMSFISLLNISCILWTGFSGQKGSESLADILIGKVNPSGRLADSWPYDYYDLPASHNFTNFTKLNPSYNDSDKHGVQLYYDEKEFVGYRYYEMFGKKPAFYFGQGLTYSTFDIESKAEHQDDKLVVDVKVTNTSEVKGKTSVLIYVEIPSEDKLIPTKSFVGFSKSKLLNEGEAETLHIEIPDKDYARYDKNIASFILRKGLYKVYVGGDISEAKEVSSFQLLEDKIVEKSISVLKEMEEVGTIDEDGKVQSRTKIVDRKDLFPYKAKRTKRTYQKLDKYKDGVISLYDVKEDTSKLDDFVSQLSLSMLCHIAVLNGSDWGGGNKTGAAGKIISSKKYKWPTLLMSDGNTCVNINKRTTGFPSSNLVASTFNKDIPYQIGEVLAKESKENGISINLGPAGNLHRNLLCGRHPEYFSEDPILAGTMMAYQARGLEENGVLATYKHLFANNAETERKMSHSIIDEETMRNLYLRVFDKALSLYKPGCIMTSYNAVNGIYPAESSELLNDLLRDQWHFDGLVMTDWGCYDSESYIDMINAGTNVLCPGTHTYYLKVKNAVRRGKISKATLQQNAKIVIKELIKCI